MKYLLEKQKAGQACQQAIFKSKASALRQVPARSLERKFINEATAGSELRLVRNGATYIIRTW